MTTPQAEPMFPIMGGPNVPWSLIAPYEAQAQKNHYQSLKRLAERGGLSICEAMAVMSSVAYEKRPIAKPSVEDWLDFIADRKTRADRRAALAAPAATGGEAITARYTNWRGETAERTFIPHRVYFGSNEWHPDPQVLIEATDCEKGALRTFAASGFSPATAFTYSSTQATACAACGEHKHTPLSRDEMGGYVCLTCIDKRLNDPAPSETGASVGEKDEANYQARVAAACDVLFDGDPTDVAERRDRFAEEANEVCQAFGMSREDAHRLIDYTYCRPIGEPSKEIGAAMTTLASLAREAGHDLMACAEADLAKLVQPETIARIRAKRATRHGRGPLPGLSPAALAEGG
ncbi:hypothetical protein [Bosea sp. F3-2]|uniref:hypothetical protein n=1 Tax=Bosea sp. F3-2 TaxID=2599640 RepID=UPI0020BE44E2|nr:hypothetical protein [Bosea sp. F3-2]